MQICVPKLDISGFSTLMHAYCHHHFFVFALASPLRTKEEASKLFVIKSTITKITQNLGLTILYSTVLDLFWVINYLQ